MLTFRHLPILYLTFASPASLAANPLLAPLTAPEVASFVERVPGCQATITDPRTFKVLGHIANNSWVLLTPPDYPHPLEMPILFRGSAKLSSNPEVQFSTTSPAPRLSGERINGVLRLQSNTHTSCAHIAGAVAPPPSCQQYSATLSLSLQSYSTPLTPLLIEEVSVADNCASNQHQRLFHQSSWLQNLLMGLGKY